MTKKLLIISMILGLMGGLTLSLGIAQTVPKVALVLDKNNYDSTEPIQVTLTIANVSETAIITSKGFKEKSFHLHLFFTDPDGKLITSNKLFETGASTPPPPRVFFINEELIQVELVEFLEGKQPGSETGWTLTMTFNARDYYALTKSGKYSVKAWIPTRTFNSYQTSGNEFFAILGSSNPIYQIESNVVNIAQAPPVSETGTIQVKVDKHTVGGGSKPGSTKEPLGGVLVRVFDKSEPKCVAPYGAAQYGFSWKKYPSIWTCSFAGEGTTPSEGPNKGTVSFPSLPPGDYLVIGLYDTTYIGSGADGLDPGETLNKYLQLIVKADGKKVPGKTTKITGSELLIIEPEYVEWDGTQEFYPFIFESVGEWTVNTSVNPPEGFVADHNSLTAEVISQLKAIQFTITNVGSKWVSTDVTYQLSHNKRKETIKSKVGIKLSEKLAKEKGLSKFGHEDKGKK